MLARGFGQDIVSDGGWAEESRNDAIQFDATILPTDVIVETAPDGEGLVLRIAGTDDRVTIARTLVDGNYRVERVRFADGTVWTHADLVTRALAATDADQGLIGSYDSETIAGGAGNDTLYGRGGNDILTGGTGNDFLQGGAHDDTYVFARGFGQDIVSDGGWAEESRNDVIAFDATILPGDVVVATTPDGEGLVLRIAGTEDRITIARTLIDGNYRIEASMGGAATIR